MNRRAVVNKSFGKALKNHRIARNATLREVGEYIDKSIGYISDIEHDRKNPPDLEMVSKIEDFLGIRDGSLMGIARTIRRNMVPNLSKRLNQNPKLSNMLLRAEKLPEYKIDELLHKIDELEEEE